MGDDPSWPRIVAEHSSLWVELADQCETLNPADWDMLLCLVDNVYGLTAIAPAKQNAPFWVPRGPDEDRRWPHFDRVGDAAVTLQMPELDPGTEGPELTDDEWDQLQTRHVRAVSESLDAPIVARALRQLGDAESFSIAWMPPTELGWFVHLHHLRGAPLASPMPATNTYGALAPLYWHQDLSMSRAGLVFEGEVVVAATLEGRTVSDATLAWMTRERAACCGSLRTLTLRNTRASEAAVERLRRLLGGRTTIHVR